MANTRKKASPPEGQTANQTLEAPLPVSIQTEPSRPSAKPRARKPAATPAPDTFAGATEPSEAFQEQLREARLLLDGLIQQSREARNQLQGVGEQRQEAGREIESLRQQSKAAHEQLLREAKESHTAHEQILRDMSNGLREAQQDREAHQKLLHEAQECREAYKMLLQDVRTGREAHHQLLHEAQTGIEQVKQHCSAVTGQLTEARKQLAEVGQLLQALPAQAEELRRRLVESETQIRSFEEAASAARKKRETVDQESRHATLHLESVRGKAIEAEQQLAALRLELEDNERRLDYAKQQRQQASKESASPASVEPEHRNRLGVTVAQGVVVAEVLPNTPAATAGLVRGDIIHSVDGEVVLSGPDLHDLIDELDEGEQVTLRVMRGSDYTVLTALLADGDEEAEEGTRLGVTVAPGVVVAEVLPGSPAAAAGLARGDVIQTVNGETIHTSTKLRDAVEALSEGADVSLQYRRGDEAHTATARL